MLLVSFGNKFSRTPKSAIHDKRLSGKDLCVLDAIGECLDNKTNTTDVSIATICALSRASKKTVLASLNSLEKLGYIKRDRRIDGNGTNAPNHYTVNFDNPIPVDCIVDKQTTDNVKDIAVDRGVKDSENGIYVVNYAHDADSATIVDLTPDHDTSDDEETPATTPKFKVKSAPKKSDRGNTSPITPKKKSVLRKAKKPVVKESPIEDIIPESPMSKTTNTPIRKTPNRDTTPKEEVTPTADTQNTPVTPPEPVKTPSYVAKLPPEIDIKVLKEAVENRDSIRLQRMYAQVNRCSFVDCMRAFKGKKGSDLVSAITDWFVGRGYIA